MRRGVTLLELLAVLVIIGITSAIGVPRIGRWLDSLAVDRAASDLEAFYRRARMAAVLQSTVVRVEFATDTLRAFFEGLGGDVEVREPGPARHRASLVASRASIRLGPNGLGLGAANTQLVVVRGRAADTLTTSRLGRLKRW